MHKFTRLPMLSGLVLALLLAGCGGIKWVDAASKAPVSPLDTVLQQMDAASKNFQSAQADLRKEVFTKVVNDTEEQKGAVYFLRTKTGATQMGMKMTTQPQQVVEFKEGKLRIYNPGTNHVDEVPTTGANKTRAETFLTLGFGGTGSDLKKAWTITDGGPVSINDGQKTVATEKLDLVSKDPDVLKYVSHVTIWVDPARDVSLKQLLVFPSGDSQTAFYSNIRPIQPAEVNGFAIKCKGKCS
jgi:hypothetical protein